MKARIVVRLRPGILDPQGTTIRRALEGLGFPEVRDMRVGKVLDLTLDETDAGRARQRLDEMCRKLLANPVIEDYTCEVVEGDDGRRAT
jgi:phosphoribosylformylglycinamidine synthase